MAYRNPPPAPLSIDEEAILANERKRKRRALLALGAVAAIGGGVAAFVLYTASKAERAESDVVASRFTMCLAGSASPEKASLRFRRSHLSVLGAASNRGEDTWPRRCAKLGHMLAENAHAHTKSQLEDVAQKLAKELESSHVAQASVGPVIDRLFEELGRSGATLDSTDMNTEPPERSTAFTVASLPKESVIFEKGVALSRVHFAPFPDTTMRMMVDDPGLGEPRVCELKADAPTLSCRGVPAPARAMSPALRLWGTTATGKPPLVFAGHRGEAGIFRSDTGARVVADQKIGTYGASVLADGTFAYLALRDGPSPEVRLLRVTPSGEVNDALFVRRSDTGNPYYATALFHDWGFFKQGSRDGNGIRLMAVHVERDALPPPIEVGRVDEVGRIEGGTAEEAHLVACRTDRGLAVRAKGWRHTYFAFLVDGRWTPTVESRLMGGELYCDGLEAITVQQAGALQGNRFWPLFAVDRCSAAGCTFTETSFKKDLSDDQDVAPVDAQSVVATDIAGKLAIVWRAGEDGALRLRVAPPAQLGVARDKVIFDDHIHADGSFRPEATLIEFKIRSFGKRALLLLHTTRGVHGFMIDGEGAMTPVSATMDR